MADKISTLPLILRDQILSFFPKPANTAVPREASWVGGSVEDASSSGILRELVSINLSLWNLALGICGLIFAYATSRTIYNLYFHPLSSFPGPKFAAVSHLYRTYIFFSGKYYKYSFALHEKYGPLVRVAPNEISIGTASGYRDIHSYHRGGDPSEHGQHFRKSKKYATTVDGKLLPRNILTEQDPEKHQQKRRRIGHAFSAKALGEQERLIMRWIDYLVSQVGKFGENGNKPLDAVKWYNMTTFDIIGDLSFGEGFGSLELGDTHPWVKRILGSIKLGGVLAQLQEFPWLDHCLKTVAKRLMPRKLLEDRKQHLTYSREKVVKRMNLETTRKDFMFYILNQKDATPPTVEEMTLECALLIVAGSETTATFLTGTTYLLLSNPPTYQRLVKEIRSTFPSYDSITYDSTNRYQAKLPYLAAVIEEGLRMFPPAPAGFPREVPKEGGYINGVFVPGKTEVYGCTWTLTRSPKFWHNPNSFVPDRWLEPPPPEYRDDKRESSNPFGFGPRACIGKNLAYMEMRLILCKILYQYELELQPESENWIERQNMYQLWEKRVPLMVKFIKRNMEGGVEEGREKAVSD